LIAAAINRQYSAYRMPPPKTGGNGIVFSTWHCQTYQQIFTVELLS